MRKPPNISVKSVIAYCLVLVFVCGGGIAASQVFRIYEGKWKTLASEKSRAEKIYEANFVQHELLVKAQQALKYSPVNPAASGSKFSLEVALIESLFAEFEISKQLTSTSNGFARKSIHISGPAEGLLRQLEKLHFQQAAIEEIKLERLEAATEKGTLQLTLKIVKYVGQGRSVEQ